MRALLALMVLSTLPARAEDDSRARVLLVVTGAEAERNAFAASVQELLGRLQVDVTVSSEEQATTPDAGFIATVRADWTKPTMMTLDVVDRDRQIHLIREFRRTDRPALVVEVAAHVVQSAVEEILHPPSDDAPRPRRPVASIEAPPVEPIVEAAPQTGLGLGVSAAFTTRVQAGASTIAFGGTANAHLDFELFNRRAAVWVGFGYLAPIEISTALVTLRVHTLSPRGGVGLDLVRGERWKVNALLGAGADLFLSTPSSLELPQNRLAPFRVDPAPVITAAVGAHWGITSRLAVNVTLQADFDLQPRRFVSMVDGARATVFGPWRVRPSLMLSFSYELFGPAPFRRSAQ